VQRRLGQHGEILRKVCLQINLCGKRVGRAYWPALKSVRNSGAGPSARPAGYCLLEHRITGATPRTIVARQTLHPRSAVIVSETTNAWCGPVALANSAYRSMTRRPADADAGLSRSNGRVSGRAAASKSWTSAWGSGSGRRIVLSLLLDDALLAESWAPVFMRRPGLTMDHEMPSTTSQ
jgi:hypothetical protein